jgi:hypothetical protein
MHQRRSMARRALPALIASLLLVLLSACTSGGNEDTGQSAAAGSSSSDPLDLRGACPSTVVIQTSWDPSAESFGALYALLGPNPQVDAKKKRVTAPLTRAVGKDTGVKLELRAGGPAIGFQQATAQLYADPGIHLAVANASDEVIQLSKTQPTIGVLALVDIDPQLILWDPATHPDWNIIADIGQTNEKVLYFGGDTYMEYLIGTGILKKSQVDGSFDGSPARFVAEQGKIAQSGYATSDPYVLEKATPEWGKPVKFQLVYDTGYPNYGSLLSIRARDKEKLAPCLKKLVPIVQQSQVDVHSKPQLQDQDPEAQRGIQVREPVHEGVGRVRRRPGEAARPDRQRLPARQDHRELQHGAGAEDDRHHRADLRGGEKADQGRFEARGRRHQRVHRPVDRRQVGAWDRLTAS